MASDDETKRATGVLALRDARDRAIAQLSEAFAHDVIGIEEFERRLTVAHRSDSLAEVEATVSDLAIDAPAPAASVVVQASPLAGATEDARVMAIFGGVERRGRWTLPRRLQASAVFGGIVLDFRDAAFLPGLTEIQVLALMGGIQIIVPPGLAVEVAGTAVMGGFGHVERIPSQLDADRPVLRVHGLAVMGGVAVETRLPGESDTDAMRRRHGERRALGQPRSIKRLPEKAGR